MKIDIAQLRKEYTAHTLDQSDVDSDPLIQFKQWMVEAVDSEVPEPNAMVLATVGRNARPSARVVLLKDIEDDSFVFYTNYNSEKGQELAAHPYAALNFNWLELQRQVRIEGKVEKVSEEVSTAYFQSRPRGSQIGAWASPQSAIIDDRAILEDNVKKLEEKYEGAEVLPKPPHWGGYALKPDLIEFWQGRPSRLHDRIRYRLDEKGEWGIERLAP
jgi:pyridoxamine 5'-phosphate oxidase